MYKLIAERTVYIAKSYSNANYMPRDEYYEARFAPSEASEAWREFYEYASEWDVVRMYKRGELVREYDYS